MQSLAFVLTVLVSGYSHGAIHRYEAYLLGVQVGRADVAIVRTEAGYRIEGSAEARGVASFFSDWRSEFYATGAFEAGKPVLETYGYDERNRKRTRTLTLTDGVIRTTRNGEPREPRPVLDGMDILTAFFIVPECWEEQLLHTGRYNYWISGSSDGREGSCEFQVRDDDGDRARARIDFEMHEGMPLPVRLYTGGVLRGRIILRERKTIPAAGSETFSP